MDHDTLYSLRELQLKLQRETETGVWATPAGRIVTWSGIVLGLLGMGSSVVAIIGDRPGAFGPVAMFMLFFVFCFRMAYVMVRERMNRQVLLILRAILPEAHTS